MSKFKHPPNTPSYVYEYDSARASAAETVKSGVVLLGSFALDGFGIDHIVQGANSTGIKELVGGLILGALSAAYGYSNLRDQQESFQSAQELEAEFRSQTQQ